VGLEVQGVERRRRASDRLFWGAGVVACTGTLWTFTHSHPSCCRRHRVYRHTMYCYPLTLLLIQASSRVPAHYALLLTRPTLDADVIACTGTLCTVTHSPHSWCRRHRPGFVLL